MRPAETVILRPATVPDSAHSDPVRVLLVDDSPVDRALAVAHLHDVRGLELDVTQAGSAAELRELRAAASWDVYLLDHHLPDGAGLDLAGEILADDDAVVMLLTGVDDPHLDEAAEALGVTDYLLKDRADSETLGRALRYALRAQRDRAALRAGEARYRQLVRALPATSVFVFDRDERFVVADGAGLGGPGLGGPELEGRPVHELLQRMDRPEFIEHYRAALSGEQRSVEHRLRDGRHLLSRFLPLTGPDGTIETGMLVAYDVSDQVQARLALEEAQTIAGVGSWEWDAATDEVRWSAELCRIWGVEPTKDPVDFDAYLERIHRDDRKRVRAVVERALAAGEAFTVEHRIVLPSGEERLVSGRGDVELDARGVPRLMRGISRDVTEARRSAARLREAQERFRIAFAQAPIGMALVTLDGRPEQVNTALVELTGRSEEELLETTLDALMHPDDRAAAASRLGSLLTGTTSRVESEQRLQGAGDLGTVWVSVHETLVRDDDGTPRHRLVQVQDVTDRRRFEDQLQHMADHDPLTGLLNRRAFQRELEQQVARTKRYGGEGALLVLDLDQFKAINDTLGHSAGDELIIETAARLRERLRESDILARLGGDEFAILLPLVSLEAAEHVADSLLATLRKTRVGTRHVTGSIGLVMLGGPAASAEELLVNADLAMYDAKEDGRNRVSVYRPGELTQPRIQSRLTWLERIQEGLDEDRFVLFAQPIIDVHSGEIHQHELLVRLKTAESELIAPGTFLDVAERFDLVQRIDREVMRKAVALIAGAQRRRPPRPALGQPLGPHARRPDVPVGARGGDRPSRGRRDAAVVRAHRDRRRGQHAPGPALRRAPARPRVPLRARRLRRRLRVLLLPQAPALRLPEDRRGVRAPVHDEPGRPARHRGARGHRPGPGQADRGRVHRGRRHAGLPTPPRRGLRPGLPRRAPGPGGRGAGRDGPRPGPALGRAAAQHVRVAAADRDPLAVEVLEQRLRVATRGAELVAQAGDRDLALGVAERDHPLAHGGQRLGVEVQSGSHPHGETERAQGRERLGLLRGQLAAARRLGPGRAQACLKRLGGGRQFRDRGDGHLRLAPRLSRSAPGAPRGGVEDLAAPQRVRGSDPADHESVATGGRAGVRSRAAASGRARATIRPGVSRVPWWT